MWSIRVANQEGAASTQNDLLRVTHYSDVLEGAGGGAGYPSPVSLYCAMDQYHAVLTIAMMARETECAKK